MKLIIINKDISRFQKILEYRSIDEISYVTSEKLLEYYECSFFFNSFDVRTKEIHLKFHLRVDIDFHSLPYNR